MEGHHSIAMPPPKFCKWFPFVFFLCYWASTIVMVSVSSFPLTSRIRGSSAVSPPNHRHNSRLYDAVSSNEEHKTTPRKKKATTTATTTTKKSVKKITTRQYAENSVVTRIAKASALRNADRELKEATAARQPSQSMSSQAAQQPRLGSLRSLTAAIDKQLIGRSSTGPGLRNSLGRPRLLSDSSMTSVVQYNSQQEFMDTISPDAALSLMNRRHIDVLKHVAVVFARPLIDNQITVEYASRIRRLVKAIKLEDYNPDLVCFVETETARPKGFTQPSKLPSSSAGYLFFRHLCAAQGIALPSDMEVYIQGVDQPKSSSTKHFLDDQEFESSPRDDVAHDPEYLALMAVTDVLDHSYLPAWRLEAKRLRVKVSLISSDYHICQIHDVQQRSPSQSALRALNTVLKPSNTTVETKWSFMYTTTAPILSRDKVQGFFYKCYITAQQLYPVVVNLRGVANNREFFQRENYLSLVSARRSLVTDMERIYNVQPSLKSVHHLSIHSGGRVDESQIDKKKPVDVVLESALLSLGRCCDLVRPAGLLTGSVSSADWKLAYSILEQAVDQILMTCDPDKPLEPLEWGHLTEESTINIQGTQNVPEDEEQDS